MVDATGNRRDIRALQARLGDIHRKTRRKADPHGLSRSRRVGRKIKKSAWAIKDHKKAKYGVSGGVIALNTVVGLATAGLSIPLQAAIAGGMHVAGVSGGKIVGHRSYRKARDKLKSLKTAKYDFGDNDAARDDIRNMTAAVEYNHDAFQRSIMSTRAALEKIEYLTKNPTLLRMQFYARETLMHCYLFSMYHDELLHYYDRYERFFDFYRVFLYKVQRHFQKEINTVVKAVEDTITQEEKWHVDRCHWEDSVHYDAREGVRICYGANGKLGGSPKNPIKY